MATVALGAQAQFEGFPLTVAPVLQGDATDNVAAAHANWDACSHDRREAVLLGSPAY